jgi:hypothetical protein
VAMATLLEVGIKSSLRSGDASIVVKRRVEVCLRRISLDLVYIPSYLLFSSLMMVDALLRWFFGVLAR